MTRVPGVVLAGGLSRRMGGGDKTLLAMGGKPILAHVLDRLSPQAHPVAINANGDEERFARFGLPVIADGVTGLPGPLAGILEAMRFARQHGAEAVLTVPADTPFLPTDLAQRLTEARAENGIAMAYSADRVHPVCALWPTTIAEALHRFLVEEQGRKILHFADRVGYRTVAFDNGADPFFNVNTPDDLEAASQRLCVDG